MVTEPVGPADTAGDLLDRLSVSGAALLVATMDGIEDGTLHAQPQPADGVTTAPKITVADARVDWTLPAFAVDRRARACTPNPGPWTTYRGERLNLDPVRPAAPDGALAPGELRLEKRRVLVGTATDPVELTGVQAPGKRRMPAVDWARGTRPERGERLG
jgi:methionyl-tRNA formyltransferase